MYAGAAPLQGVAQARWTQGGIETRSMSGDESFDRSTANILNLVPGGSDRTVTLPDEEESAGMFVFFRHSGSANVITVQTAAPTTIATLQPGDGGLLNCDGTTWRIVEAYRPVVALPDPGDTEAIPVERSCAVALTSGGGGGETRTVAAPSFAGQTLDLTHDVDGGANIAVTFATALNSSPGDTVATFSTAGTFLRVAGAQVGGSLVWRIVANDGVGLS
jgi:hypothetical protein